MVYHEREDAIKKSGWGRLILRIVGILILVGAVAAVAMYRDQIMKQVSKVLAASDEEPIPVLSLERGPLTLDVQANGEIVGLETVAVPTPNTSAGSLKLAWLIPEGTMVKPGDAVVQIRQHRYAAAAGAAEQQPDFESGKHQDYHRHPAVQRESHDHRPHPGADGL